MRKYYKILVGCCIVFTLNNVARAEDAMGIQGIINRQFPFLKNKVFIEVNSDGQSELNDSFNLSTRNNSLYIKANSLSAASCALNYYLENYCHMSISHSGDNVGRLKKLPIVKGDIKVVSRFKYRYALNYCTYNYSYSFYNWKDWERELDWMALRGVNLMLTPMGTELIWKKVLASNGFSEKEISDFIPGPAFNAWWLMGNLEGWGGPVSDRMIAQWSDMQKKILARLDELGINPILPAFTGIVPHLLRKKFPNAKIIEQGRWAGGFQRPDFLSPEDSLFGKMAKEYYLEMKRYYGEHIRFLSGDLFHEGGVSNGINVSKVAGMIQQNMQLYYPESHWVLQGWQGNPSSELLSGLDRNKTLIIDLMGEMTNNWEKTDGYHQFPWIWCSINNWGGKTGMGAMLERILEEPMRAESSPQGKNMYGIGIIPEGISNNPITYQWALNVAWENQSNKDILLNKYILSRYGKYDPDVFEGWKLLLKSLYGNYADLQKGATESIFCGRPALNITNVSTWGPGDVQYDTRLPEQALILFHKAYPKFSSCPSFKYDITDLARQVISNRGRTAYKKVMNGIVTRNADSLAYYSEQFIALLKMQDNILATHRDFMLGSWLKKARDYGISTEEKNLCEQNARTQITYWGADNSATNLHEYAHKEWSGLLSDFYLPRWKLFFKQQKELLSGKSTSQIDYFPMEADWTRKHNKFPINPKGDIDRQIGGLLARFHIGL